MATIKAYTDLSQSNKLAEILPLESADMMYHSVENEYGSGAFVATSKIITNGFENDNFYIDDIPCWSLAALLKVISNIFKYNLDYNGISFILTVGDFEYLIQLLLMLATK
jgi:hypothetical protein